MRRMYSENQLAKIIADYLAKNPISVDIEDVDGLQAALDAKSGKLYKHTVNIYASYEDTKSLNIYCILCNSIAGSLNGEITYQRLIEILTSSVISNLYINDELGDNSNNIAFMLLEGSTAASVTFEHYSLSGVNGEVNVEVGDTISIDSDTVTPL